MKKCFLFKRKNILNILVLSLCVFATSTQAQGYFSTLDTSIHKQEIFQELKQVMLKFKEASEAKKLEAVNNFFNQRMRYADDVHLWSQSDYWATPFESMVKRAGDCEDFAIAKYMLLKALNIPVKKLRLSYVRVVIQNKNGSRVIRPHMIVAYYNAKNKDPLILDNLFKQVVPASLRPDLTHVYSFNEDNLWVGKAAKPKASAQPCLSKWRDILARMRQQPSQHSML